MLFFIHQMFVIDNLYAIIRLSKTKNEVIP